MERDQTIPIGGRVLLELPESKRTDNRGIVILEKDKAYANGGVVIAVGAGRIGKNGKRVSIEVKPGDKVYIAKFAGTQVKLDGIDHLMLFSEDVIGVQG